MSFNAMLKHRCSVKRLVEGEIDGIATASWSTTSTNVRCFIDLNFIRKGKDPMWTAEAGRRTDRTGVLFALSTADIRPGDRVSVTKGPVGTFEVQGAVDEAWRPLNLHHLELGVVEVQKQLSG